MRDGDAAADAATEAREQEAAALSRALVDLIELQGPICDTVAKVEAAVKFCGPWLDRSERLAVLRRDHVRAVLRARLAETINEHEARVWARTFQGRTAWVKTPAETVRPLILLERNFQVALRIVLGSMAAPQRSYPGTLMSLETEGIARMLAVLDCENPTGPDDFGPYDPVKGAKLTLAWDRPRPDRRELEP